jgi:hypothetical protein
MADSREHYSELLSPVYTWMAGGWEAAVARNEALFDALGVKPLRSGKAVDLGCGSGFQSVPLARLGFDVTAIDLDPGLTTAAVADLCRSAWQALVPGGRFIVTFRDLSNELTGLDRFIPVRSDDDRIFTCFLEYEPETVKVHDLVYSREPTGWNLEKSWYRKLRLSPAQVVEMIEAAGFSSTKRTGA